MSAPANKAFPVSWDQFHRDCKALAWRLAGAAQANGGEWKAIVSITRGGLVPAAIIARELGIRTIETVCIASYHDYQDQGELRVLKDISRQADRRDRRRRQGHPRRRRPDGHRQDRLEGPPDAAEVPHCHGLRQAQGRADG